ncbi:vitamin K epoxide reductase family protein [Streptomyces tubbatahanensis]|uniref:Vitamin K epoxide reductase family protein n=1 Tax=Streptomyces tubbatahanensis TaxID=2923272 RepID=A0ABY3XNF7_9ACTN|nr:vitamin K epoxide reductase family protein [Streptomyces tubbatahanensis]UNS95961.1 vitamin K epoxide reductase family protein [Streptomyces tubbatahanensis]
MTMTAPPGEAHVTADAPKGGAVGASRAFGWMLIITGAAGLLASWVITLDKFKLLEDKNFKPACSINPVIACGNIMQSDQAAAFGAPNPMIGLVAYGVVVCVGVCLLTRVTFPRWYWLTFNAGCLFGVGFVSWLQYQSLYVIGNLCLWCCLAWVITIVMFWYVTAHNVRSGFLPAPAGVRGFADEFPWVLPVLHIGVIGILVLTRWWDFWTG